MALFDFLRKTPTDSAPNLNTEPPVSLATASQNNAVPKEEEIKPLQIEFDDTVREKNYHSFINKLGITQDMLKNGNVGSATGLHIDDKTGNLVVPKELLAEQGNLFLNYVLHPENHPSEQDFSAEFMKKLLFDAAFKVEINHYSALNIIFYESSHNGDMPKAIADSVHKILDDIQSPEQLPIFRGLRNDRALHQFFLNFNHDSNGISTHIMDISEKINDESKLKDHQYTEKSVMNTLIHRFFDPNSDKDLMFNTMNRLIDKYPAHDTLDSNVLLDVITNVTTNPNKELDDNVSRKLMQFIRKIFDKAPQSAINGKIPKLGHDDYGDASYGDTTLLEEALMNKYVGRKGRDPDEHNPLLDRIITKLVGRSTIQDLEYNRKNVVNDKCREFLDKEIKEKRQEVDPVAKPSEKNVPVKKQTKNIVEKDNRPHEDRNKHENRSEQKPSAEIGMSFTNTPQSAAYQTMPSSDELPTTRPELLAEKFNKENGSLIQPQQTR